jgi:RHS repeat-associated protein
LNQYFLSGEIIGGGAYFFTKDHLGSIREMTDTSGNIQAQYEYDPFGRVAQIQGSASSDFQYAGYYYHAPSALSLTLCRVYNANLGRWINRDPIAENGGINLYDYVANNPISNIDVRGLAFSQAPISGIGSTGGNSNNGSATRATLVE